MRASTVLLSVAMAAALGACGGGGTSTPYSSSSQTVSEFMWNGVTYDYFGPAWGTQVGPTTTAPCGRLSGTAVCVERVSVDGLPISATETALAPGRIVRMRSTVGANVTIDIQRAVVGTVDSVDADAGVVTILGQRVRAFAPTWWIDPQVLAVGNRVAVSGFFDGAGEISPTRVEKESAGQDSVRGVLVRDEGWWIGELPVDLTNATHRGFPAGIPLAGDAVLVVGTQSPGAPFIATMVQYAGGDFPTSSATSWQLEGFVTASRGTTDFDVGGLRVAVGNCNCSQFTAPLAVGTPVVVRGGGGSTVPTTVSARPFSDEHRFTGPIESIDWAAGTVTVLGFAATMSPNAPIELPGSITTWRSSAGPLSPGDWISLHADDVDGSLLGSGITLATGNVPSILTWGGAVTLEDPAINVLRRPILTDGQTANGYCSPHCGFNSVRTLFATGIYHYTIVDITLASATHPLLATRISVE